MPKVTLIVDGVSKTFRLRTDGNSDERRIPALRQVSFEVQDHQFVSLDLPTEAAQAEQQPENFLHRHPPPVIIDDVQYAPGLFRHLKAAVDARRSRNGR